MTKITECSTDNEEARVRKFAKHMLKSSIFIGTFVERRLVDTLHSYRDVIKISDNETDLIDNLKAVKKRCSKHFPRNVWIGITEPSTIGAPAGHNIWVTSNTEVFGTYWYKIKNVDFFYNEVRIRVEVVRPVVREQTPDKTLIPHIIEDVCHSDFTTLHNNIKKASGRLFSETLTWSNIKQATIFVFILLSTLLTFLVQSIHYLMEYSLKLLHETQGLIKVCTPIFISLMKLIMNTINGFYALIVIMWRDRSAPKVNQNPTYLQIAPYTPSYHNYNVRALPYGEPYVENRRRYVSSVKITPLD